MFHFSIQIVILLQYLQYQRIFCLKGKRVRLSHLLSLFCSFFSLSSLLSVLCPLLSPLLSSHLFSLLSLSSLCFLFSPSFFPSSLSFSLCPLVSPLISPLSLFFCLYCIFSLLLILSFPSLFSVLSFLASFLSRLLPPLSSPLSFYPLSSLFLSPLLPLILSLQLSSSLLFLLSPREEKGPLAPGTNLRTQSGLFLQSTFNSIE